MMPGEPPKVPCMINVEVDRISNLPGHVIDKILTQLSLRDAVRTSILSSKWRYKWFTIPHLVFDDQCVLASSQDQTVLKNKLVNVVDSVLLLHMGPIQKFKLSHRDLQGVSDIDRWILHLSRVPIKEFILEIWKGHRYKIPSSLYFSQMLVHLELFNCLLKPPPIFTGFRSLKSLDLQHITIEQQVFEHMISSCPLLERLTLMNFDGFTLLNIDAPNLQFFDIGGVFNDVHFQKTDCLAIVSIGLYQYIGTDQNLTLGFTDNLVKFFNPLPCIQRLEIQSYFLKYLAIGKIPVKLPNPCVELNYLSVRVNINDLDESLAVQCLLRSSPNLLELEILARPDKQTGSRIFGSLWKEDYNCFMNQLRFVKVVGIVGDKCELDFINFLLANSPTLERMTVKPASNDKGWDLLKELVRFRRASVQAEIIYLDP